MAAEKAPQTSMDLLQGDRPRFPEGLRVLLVEANSSSEAFSLLKGFNYEVMAVADLEGAITALQRSSAAYAAHSYDVILADATFLGSGQHQLFMAAGTVPVVLMGEQCSSAQVLQAVEDGAADFLERPLSQLKLRNLWQHTVRAMMSSTSCQSSPKAVAASTAGTPAGSSPVLRVSRRQTPLCEKQHVVAAQPSTELRECHVALGGDCCDVPHSPDCLDGLSLPPLVPSQLNFDPDSIFLDLDCPVADNEPSLDDILQPCTPPEDSAAATDLLGGYSSDQYGCSSGATAFQNGELDSCADTMSCMPGLPLSAGNSSAGALASYSCHTSSKSESQLTCSTTGTAVAAATGSAGPAAGWLVAPSWGNCHLWGMPAVPQGMVWGMPILNVATAPGIVVTAAKDVSTRGGQMAAVNNSSTAAASVAAAAPAAVPQPVVPPMCWPMMSTMMMPKAGAAAAAASTACMPYASMPYAGMFPPMGCYMGAAGCMPLGTPLGMLAQWPAAAGTGFGPGVIQSTTAAAGTRAGAAGSAPAAGTPASGAADTCRSGSIASSSKSVSLSMLCTDSLFGPGPADRLVC